MGSKLLKGSEHAKTVRVARAQNASNAVEMSLENNLAIGKKSSTGQYHNTSKLKFLQKNVREDQLCSTEKANFEFELFCHFLNCSQVGFKS